jgi:NADPH:quinone reductase-like Zn-dependent oxidoreductase
VTGGASGVGMMIARFAKKLYKAHVTVLCAECDAAKAIVEQLKADIVAPLNSMSGGDADDNETDGSDGSDGKKAVKKASCCGKFPLSSDLELASYDIAFDTTADAIKVCCTMCTILVRSLPLGFPYILFLF